MALTLAVANNQNGTATATVGGSAGGLVTVNVNPVTLNGAAGSWSAGGSRTGNGPVTLTPAAGYYWAYAVEGADVSPPAYFAVTTSTTSVQEQVRNAVQGIVVGLGLTVPGSGAPLPVYRQFDPQDVNTKLPNVTITNRGLADQQRAMTSVLNEYGYGCRVLLFGRVDVFDQSQFDLYDLWRDTIVNALDGPPLPGLTYDSVRTDVAEIPHGDPSTRGYQHLVHALTVTAAVWRTRGR